MLDHVYVTKSCLFVYSDNFCLLSITYSVISCAYVYVRVCVCVYIYIYSNLRLILNPISMYM